MGGRNRTWGGRRDDPDGVVAVAAVFLVHPPPPPAGTAWAWRRDLRGAASSTSCEATLFLPADGGERPAPPDFVALALTATLQRRRQLVAWKKAKPAATDPAIPPCLQHLPTDLGILQEEEEGSQ